MARKGDEDFELDPPSLPPDAAAMVEALQQIGGGISADNKVAMLTHVASRLYTAQHERLTVAQAADLAVQLHDAVGARLANGPAPVAATEEKSDGDV